MRRGSCSHLSRPGFSLVVTMILLMCVGIITLGLLGISAVTLRSSAHDELDASARQNARLALMLALGELQELAGPDRRVTARAEILDNTPDIHDDKTLAHPNWTGVWESWKWDGTGEAPRYHDEKDRRFLGWLASHSDPESQRSLRGATSEQAGLDEFVFHDGTAAGRTDVIDIVRGVTVPIESSGHSGSYSWVVLDEGQKARFGLPHRMPADQSHEIAAQNAPSSPHFAGLDRIEKLDALDNEARSKLLSLAQLGLAQIEEADEYTHDISPWSVSLLTDVVNGGFAHDLSLLLEQPELPRTYAGRHLYSNAEAPLVVAPARFPGANPFPSPDPSWRLLRSHYNLYRQVRDADGSPFLDATFLPRPPAGTPPEAAMQHPSFHRQNIAPVVAKAQFVFSLSAGWHPLLDSLRDSGAAGADDQYVSWLVTDPVITLWNPYNVALRFREARIDLYRIPLAFRLYKNGELINREFTHFANTFIGGDLRDRTNRFYRLNLKPRPRDPHLTLQPGEFVVFTPHNHVKHHRHEYSQAGLDLRPGFNAPAGNASNEFVGGVSTLNVCVDSRGEGSGRINGVSVRSIPLKPGDTLQLEVAPQRATVDRFAENGGQEITTFLRYTEPGDDGQAIGGIEFDYGTDESARLPSFARADLTTFVVPHDIPAGLKADESDGPRPPPAVRFKEPFLIASLQLKSEQDSRFPSRNWIHNAPDNLYASTGLDQHEHLAAHQYEFTWEPMTDWTSSPTIEIDQHDRGYGAAGIYAQTGREFAPFRGVPLTPPVSLAEFRHAPLNAGGQLPLTTQVIGNSFAHPLLARRTLQSTVGARTFLDHSYLANNRLFDHYFLSGATRQDTALHDSPRTLQETLRAFLSRQDLLPNPRFRPYHRTIDRPDDLASRLDSTDGYRRFGAYLLLEGGFNVNSTSVEAWRAFLSSVSTENLLLLDALSGKLGHTRGEGAVFSRFTPPAHPDLDSATDPEIRNQRMWAGYRRLNSGEIARLAEAIVEQVKRRGPFQSVAEFVNRRAEASDLGLHGALQAAIEQSGLNAPFRDTGVPVQAPSDTYRDPAAAAGLTSDGAPAALNQADLLAPLAPFVTVRSDTYRIRAMGEATDARGHTIRVVCEAVVQRLPEYVDPGDPPFTAPANLPRHGANDRFGRRFEVISFRWLSAAEL